MTYRTIPSVNYHPSTSIGYVGGPGPLKIVKAARRIGKAAFGFTTKEERERGQWRYCIIAAEQDPRVDADEHRLNVGSSLLDKLGDKVPVITVDGRYPELIHKHIKDTMRAILIPDVQCFPASTSFSEGKNNRLAYEVEKLKKDGLMVVYDGVDKWYNGTPAEPTATMMSLSEKVIKMYQFCDLCPPQHKNKGVYTWMFRDGKPASFNDEILRGPDDILKSVCLEHFIELTNDPKYESLKAISGNFKRYSAHLPKLRVYAGPMFGGKSDGMIFDVEAASRQLKCEKMFFKPAVDTRTPFRVGTRAGATNGRQFGTEFFATELVDNRNRVNRTSETPRYLTTNMIHAIQMLHDGNLVEIGVDEPWMLDKDSIEYALMALKLNGYPVSAAVLTSDFAKRGVGATPTILSMANHVEILSASCACGNLANYTQRYKWDYNDNQYIPAAFNDPIVVVEASKEDLDAEKHEDKYDVKCLYCHTTTDAPEEWH